MDFNANYQIIPISGTMNFSDLGYASPSGTSIHQVYCLSSGSITIGAIGGGSATVSMTSGQTINCLLSYASVSGGTFIGFRAKPMLSYLTNGQV